MPGDFDSDAMLAFIGQMGKEVDNLKTKIAGLNEAGGKGMGNLANETERFGKVIQRYTAGPVKAMDAAVAGLTKTLVGAGGLALGLAGVAKAFDTFAVGELKIKNFATNTGFSVDSIKNLRVQLAAAGIDAGAASQGIAGIGAKLQDVLALQETSSFYKSLQASSPALAEQIRHLMNAGKQQEALNVLQEAYNHGGERFKAWLPTVTTYSRAAFEAGIVGIKGLIEPWKFNDEEARNYHKTMTNLGTVTDGVWTSMTYTMIASINKMIGAEGMEKLNQKAHDFADGFKGFFATYVSPTLSTTKEEFGWVVDALAKVDEYITKLTGGDTKEGETPSGDSTGRLAKFLREDIWKRRPADAPPPPSIGDDISGAWNWLKKNMSFTSEAHADTLPLGTMPMAGTAKDVAEVDKDSNKLLGDMRDTLQKWDQLREGVTAGGGGTQMASLGPGGGALGATGDNPAGGGGRGASRGGNTSTGGPPGAEGPVSTEDPGAGLQGSDYLAARRASQMKEIENNPQLKLAIAAMVTKEHESDPVAVMESLANRTDYVNSERAKQGLPPVSLQQMLMGKPGGKSFYGPIRSGQLPGAMAALQNDPKRLQRIYDAMGQVYAGSNVLQGATDQGSGNDPNVAWGGGKVVRHGETYNDFGGGPGGHEGARRYREALQKGVREGKGFPIAGQPNRGAAIDAALRNYYGAGGATGTARVDVDFGDQAAKKPLMSGASPFIPTHVHRAPQAPLAGGSASSYTQYAFE